MSAAAAAVGGYSLDAVEDRRRAGFIERSVAGALEDPKYFQEIVEHWLDRVRHSRRGMEKESGRNYWPGPPPVLMKANVDTVRAVTSAIAAVDYDFDHALSNPARRGVAEARRAALGQLNAVLQRYLATQHLEASRAVRSGGLPASLERRIMEMAGYPHRHLQKGALRDSDAR